MTELSDPVFAEFCAAGLWPGAGKALWQAFPDAGIRSARDVTQARLRTLPRVTDTRAARLFTAWIGAGQAYALAELLVPEEIPVRWVSRLIDALGDNAATALRSDPWRLLVLPDAVVGQADRLARAIEPGVRRDDPRRGRALVAWTLNRFARDGHTAAATDDLAGGLRPFGMDADAVTTAVASAVAGGDVVRVADPVSGTPDWIATTVLATAETEVADAVLRLERAAVPLVKDIGKAGAVLDRVQRSAVAHAAEHGVSVLTGGPGTGKSRTVAAIVEMCRAAKISIALAAPTGRAAKRLEELTGAEAMTIHRLLGARGGPVGDGDRFEYNAENPVDAKLVVIDEASMLDVELAAALMSALPDGTHLVVVGDPAQLPSIGPGRVLGDLIDAGTLPVVELETLYRQSAGGSIARLATAVRAGELPRVDDPTREVVVVPARGSGEAAHRVVQLVTQSIPRAFGTTADQLQVVTPVHRGDAGTQSLNRALKAALNPGRGSVRGFDVGDRVVATANHTEATPVGYANGEVGTVTRAADNSLTVEFTGGRSDISGKALNDLLHGWAITVHRAQGSEWEAVVAVMPPEAGSMLSRPLVYTALTRARLHLSVVHSAGPALARAVEQIGQQPRRTRLRSLLTAAPGSATAT
ncbi:ATP-dependent DNA helicase [Nakamurella deserti]|uniref:ATP-dependent DNA helicase n=1 Tax=Nakamurella deserti TaxID=2164074 RepID=UPI001F0CD635|nr:AAA family ATPase [Nakamurella deserti]